jgi:hypothetical protein
LSRQNKLRVKLKYRLAKERKQENKGGNPKQDAIRNDTEIDDNNYIPSFNISKSY